MTMRPILFVSSFLLAVATDTFAQQPVTVPPVPPAVRVPDVHVYTPATFPAVDWTIPEFHLPELPDPRHIEETVTHALAQAEKAITVVGTGKAGPFQFGQYSTQPQALYSQARNWIDRNNYERALEPLDKLISARGERADAAMYWKAYSLMKLARRDEALSTLSQLPKQFPESRWLGDARALEVEVKQSAGQPVGTDTADDEVKLLAVQGIMRTDPDAGLPVIEKMLAGGSSVRVKERALFVLSQSRNDRARTILGNIARGGANPDLQLTAIRYLGTSNTPDAIATLTAVYKADSSIDTRKAVVNALISSSRNTAAITALIALARAERNPELKTTIVRHLSNSSAPEAKAYMVEILSK